MTDPHADIGPARPISLSELQRLTAKLRFESALADECASAGRSHNPDRAIDIMLKIHAMLDGLTRVAARDEDQDASH